jgi:hypothetical protein
VNIRCRIQGFPDQSGSGSTTQLFTFLLTEFQDFSEIFQQKDVYKTILQVKTHLSELPHFLVSPDVLDLVECDQFQGGKI